MPELPEIETLCRSLKSAAGKKVVTVEFSKLAPVETTTPRAIRKALLHKVLASPRRRGKYLLLLPHGGGALVIHLGMSGVLRWASPGEAPPPHTHFQMKFSDHTCLRFSDPRRFGTLSLTRQDSFQDNLFLSRLGPDYDDPQLKLSNFLERCRRHSGLSLKSLALHQGVAAGLGNIYACEALYLARLDPQRRVRATSDEELGRLLRGARKALALGIRYGGVSMRDYLDGNGHRGVMQDFLQVYDREGLPSLEGLGRVRRIVQNARSTWYCPEVQL